MQGREEPLEGYEYVNTNRPPKRQNDSSDGHDKDKKRKVQHDTDCLHLGINGPDDIVPLVFLVFKLNPGKCEVLSSDPDPET